MGDDCLARVLDGRQPLAVLDGQAAARDFAEQDAMKVGAPDRDAEPGSAQVEIADDASVEISELELARRCAGSGDPFGQAECRQHAHAVRRNLETAANGGRFRMGFEDPRREAGALQEQGDGRPRDAAADDEGAMFLCHACQVTNAHPFSPVMIHDRKHHGRESVCRRPEPAAGAPHRARGAQRHARGRPPARHAVSGEQRPRAPSRPAGRRARGAQRAGSRRDAPRRRTRSTAS